MAGLRGECTMCGAKVSDRYGGDYLGVSSLLSGAPWLASCSLRPPGLLSSCVPLGLLPSSGQGALVFRVDTGIIDEDYISFAPKHIELNDKSFGSSVCNFPAFACCFSVHS